MTDLSNSYAALAATAQVSISGNRATFNAVPGANGVGVFNLNAADLSRFGEIAFNANGADTVIVNVRDRRSGSTTISWAMRRGWASMSSGISPMRPAWS